MPQEHWDALAAEKRALRRAAASAQEAAHLWRRAAEPHREPQPAALLDRRAPVGHARLEFTQAGLVHAIRQHTVFKLAPVRSGQAGGERRLSTSCR